MEPPLFLISYFCHPIMNHVFVSFELMEFETQNVLKLWNLEQFVSSRDVGFPVLFWTLMYCGYDSWLIVCTVEILCLFLICVFFLSYLSAVGGMWFMRMFVCYLYINDVSFVMDHVCTVLCIPYVPQKQVVYITVLLYVLWTLINANLHTLVYSRHFALLRDYLQIAVFTVHSLT